MKIRHLLALTFTGFAALFLGDISARAASLVEAGLPAASREWSGKDYENVAEILSSGKVPLPNLDTAEGRAFLQRLTSVENLSIHRNSSIPLNARMADFSAYLPASSAILKAYAAEANRTGKLHTEMVVLMGFFLHVAESGILLSEEFMPTVPRDEKYPVRIAGLKKMKSGLTTVFSGAEQSLHESAFYSADDLSLLLQSMTEVLPVVKRAFGDDYKLELRKKFEAAQASSKSERDVANYKKMVAELGS